MTTTLFGHWVSFFYIHSAIVCVCVCIFFIVWGYKFDQFFSFFKSRRKKRNMEQRILFFVI